MSVALTVVVPLRVTVANSSWIGVGLPAESLGTTITPLPAGVSTTSPRSMFEEANCVNEPRTVAYAPNE